MEATVNLSTTQISACSRMFSSAVVRELAVKEKSPRLVRLAQESGLLERMGPGNRVADIFEESFNILKKRGLRDEYIYKAALTHRILLGKHSLNTASMLTEFRAGECRADIAILNGTITVYEIKSERDSLARLERQIRNYRRVFARIVVIAAENHVKEVLQCTPSEVGVMRLTRKCSISTEREAVDFVKDICPATILDSLRVAEAKKIMRRLGRQVPSVPNTQMHAALRNLFTKADPEEVHAAMIPTLKKSRSLLPLATLVDRLPASLQPAALMVPLRKSDHDKFVAAVEMPVHGAMKWT